MKHFLGYFHTGQDAVFLDEQPRLAHGIFGNATQGGMVTIADVFGKRQVDEPVCQFFYFQHNNISDDKLI